MIESIKNIIELFLDKSKHWTLKAGVFISVIGMLFILDITFDLSYDNFLTNKLENIEKIQIIKKNYEADSLKLIKIKVLEDQILNKKHYSELIFKNLDSSLNTLKATLGSSDTTVNKSRSYFLMLLSSNFFFLLIIVILIFSPFFDKDFKTLKSITSWFASLTSFSSIIFATTWLTFRIPIINNDPNLNYFLNFCLHIFLVILLVKIFSKDGKITIY
jgi:hypothetical protein